VIFIFLYPSFSEVNAAITAGFTIDKSTAEYCIGDTVKYTNTSNGEIFRKWNFGDGSETYLKDPEHIYNQSGSFTTTITVYDTEGNSDTFSLEITINSLPELELSPSADTTIFLGESVNIIANGDFTSSTWSTGEESDNITVTLSGTYSVFVNENSNQCYNSDSISVVVESFISPEKTEIIIVNNVLTPNGDGINDYFMIKNIDGYNYKCEILIYNKLGNLMFSDSNYQNKWDGTSNNGSLLDAGTYYYILKTQDKKGGTGFIDIIR
jgi:gliding motility-associated-like protein